MSEGPQDSTAPPPQGGWIRADENRFVIAPRLREPGERRLAAILGDWRVVAGVVLLGAALSGALYAVSDTLMDALDSKEFGDTELREPEDPALAARAEAIVPDLFGSDYTFEDVRDYDAGFARELMAAIARQDGPGDLESARVFTRTVIVQSRANMAPDQLLEASDVYLRWLRAAQAQGAGACREVTSHSFYEGVPTLRGEDEEAEQRLLRSLIESVWLEYDGEIHNRELPPPPRWAEVAAAESSGLSPATLRAALGDLTHPERCTAAIHVLDALLARPKIAPATFLERV